MDKVYIVANKEQELEVLKKLEQDGFVWVDNEKPTSWIPSDKMFVMQYVGFPYALSCRDGSINGSIIWVLVENIKNQTIVYDGRKEEKMSKKYLVTQEFMNELIEWSDDQRLSMNTELIRSFLDVSHIQNFPDVVDIWWTDPENTVENNNRLVAIIQWLNGEDVFETQKTYKYFVARTSSPFAYLSMNKMYHSEFPKYDSDFSKKKIFDTREEAEKWLIPGYKVEGIDVNDL